MHIYDLTVPQLSATLRNLDRWLTLASAHAQDHQVSVDSLLNARLAPDQYMLVRQIQVACDNAKYIAGRLAAKEWPSHPDTESTFDQLRSRIGSVLEYLGTFARDDFEEVERRKIKLPWMKEDEWLAAYDYLVGFALPNFYFHIVTAYAILRHKGVKLGKNDFLGRLPIQS